MQTFLKYEITTGDHNRQVNDIAIQHIVNTVWTLSITIFWLCIHMNDK